MKTKIIPVPQLQNPQIARMFEIMTGYYDNMKEENFRRDLQEKEDVILLLSPDGGIQGFSTILHKEMNIDGEKMIALYSGDTVLDKKYWGNGALGLAFGRYLLRTKMKNPFRRVYWFLISKGYKTYLLMTNNFYIHYPRYNKSTPALEQKIMDTFYGERFANQYSAAEGLIHFESVKSSPLKYSVADITADLMQNPKIAYFARKNPGWNQGVELACVAKVTIWVPVFYVVKRIYKKAVKLKA
jgi:hypothetical protein